MAIFAASSRDGRSPRGSPTASGSSAIRARTTLRAGWRRLTSSWFHRSATTAVTSTGFPTSSWRRSPRGRRSSRHRRGVSGRACRTTARASSSASVTHRHSPPPSAHSRPTRGGGGGSEKPRGRWQQPGSAGARPPGRSKGLMTTPLPSSPLPAKIYGSLMPQPAARKPGLSVFFPAYNDSGTIASLVISALRTARRLTDDYEVIIVNDGSADGTADIANELARTYPQVRVVHHDRNRGYGGALRSGFAAATRDLVFYTDGDAQYDPREMTVLWRALTDAVDLVNGYKISRSDPLHRIVIGRVYHHTVKILFGLQVRDVDCDFRLMRRNIFDRVNLHKDSGVICLEMMKKIQDAGFRIAEVPVHHYHRAYGRSQFFNFRRLFKTAIDVMKLWVVLVVRREHVREPASKAHPVRHPGAGNQ